MNFDAKIVLSSIPKVGYRATGKIYADKAGRFSNGTDVMTSTVQEIGDMWFRTRNTVYEIIAPIEKQMTTHEFAQMLLKYPDVPVYTCEYDGDIESEDYEMVLSPAIGVDYGVVKGTAVICVGEERIGFEELVEKLHAEREEKALVELIKMSRDDVENGRVMGVQQALGRLGRDRKPVEIIEISCNERHG
ncbi:hypothetical protein AsFcp4_86 [Aeromonas phage AsFcp_4]|nr:hypothetical protein AsFcp4_86 [Aeromonas phage AsFcp_4]